MRFKGDFHIHTCLSPCADITMVPNAVARELERTGVEWVAITDHNSCGNVKVFDKVLGNHGIKVIAGAEIQTVEEVHVLAYFETIDIAEEFSEDVSKHLPGGENDPEEFGYQLYVDENDEFTGMEDSLLAASTDLTLEALWKIVKGYGGLFVYSHVDRAFGIVKQLGFIPEEPRFDAVEVLGGAKVDCAVLKSSDAHFLSQFNGPKVEIESKSRTFEGFRRALAAKEVWTI